VRQVRLRLLLPAAALFAAAVGATHYGPQAPPFSGPATVADGDTIRVNGERVRLIGIDAPELEQSCTDANGAAWSCGRAARDKMVALAAGDEVSCRPDGRDRYGRTLAVCTAGNVDLGRAMVQAGLAVADGGYLAEAETARSARVGIWGGSFINPAQWRRQGGNSPAGNFMAWLRGWFG
jgi:endonuclease YncB( thermonuclease family)